MWPGGRRPAPRHEVDQEYKERDEPRTEKRREEEVGRVARMCNRKFSTGERGWKREEEEQGGEGETENDY